LPEIGGSSPKMRTDMGNPELIGFATITGCCITATSNPVHLALARAKNAILVRFYQIHHGLHFFKKPSVIRI